MTTPEITAVWLKRLGDRVLVEAEIGGRWVPLIEEHFDGAFSHIIETGGIRKRLSDSLLRQRVE
jgi:hypothetical protein